MTAYERMQRAIEELKNPANDHDDVCELATEAFDAATEAIREARDDERRRATPSVQGQQDVREILSLLHADPHDGRTPIEIASEIVWRMRAEIERLKDGVELHRCKVCGALWRKFPDSWSLFDGNQKCGKCCDNAAMGEQIEFIGYFRPRDGHIQQFSASVPAVDPQGDPTYCKNCLQAQETCGDLKQRGTFCCHACDHRLTPPSSAVDPSRLKEIAECEHVIEIREHFSVGCGGGLMTQTPTCIRCGRDAQTVIDELRRVLGVAS